jgi:hypothetical protein
MKIKNHIFSTLVLELFFPSIANCKKLKIPKIQKFPKIDFPYCIYGISVSLSIATPYSSLRQYQELLMPMVILTEISMVCPVLGGETVCP